MIRADITATILQCMVLPAFVGVSAKPMIEAGLGWTWGVLLTLVVAVALLRAVPVIIRARRNAPQQ